MKFSEIADHLNQKLADKFVIKDGLDVLFVQPENLLEVMSFLNSDKSTSFDTLLCITAYDDKILGSAYNLFSLEEKHYIEVRVEVDRDNPIIPTVESIWKAANWHEREAYDLFGIKYEGHSDLRRILLPNDWEGYPLRKDFVTPEFYNGMPVPKDKTDWE